MADTTTSNVSLTKPEVGASADSWGTKINTNFDTLDSLFTSGPALLVSKGGTGATTASAARTNLGLVIGTDVQAYDSDLTTWAGKTVPSGDVAGTTDTQTFTNKTLTSPTITSPTITGATISSSTISGGAITLGTSQTSTSGTSISFTGIPSWAKRITIMFSAVSTNGTSSMLVQIGDAGGLETTGYVSAASTQTNVIQTSTAGFILDSTAISATYFRHGALIISTIGNNNWVAVGNIYATSPFVMSCAGSKTLSDTLTQLSITTVSGDTFDSGVINISYE